MKAVHRKLKSRRGASMLIALVFFLVAASIGAAVLVAASSNAGRIAHHRNDLREYYAVQSAVKLVKKDMADEKFSAEYWKEEEYDWEDPEYNDPGDPDSGVKTEGYYDCTDTDYDQSAALTADGLLETQESDFEANFFSGADWTDVSDSYTAPTAMKYDLAFAAEKGGAALPDFPAVKGTLEVDPSTYDVTVTLQTENGTNPIELYFEAVVHTYSRTSGSKPAGKTFDTRGITVTWHEAEVTKR